MLMERGQEVREMKKGKVGQLVGLGAFFWLVAALIIRFTGDRLFRKDNPWLIPFYVLLWPIAYLFVKIGTVVARIEPEDMVESVAVMDLTALMLDGVALTWFRKLYGEEFETTHHGAAAILYGAGAVLMVAFLLRSRAGSA
jgi:hypothetical protein